jgi:hypothetical protein
LLPLDDPEGNPLGLISLDDPSNGLRPDRASIESVELFAAQVVQVIINNRRIGDLTGRIEALTSGLPGSRTPECHENDFLVFLRKTLNRYRLHELIVALNAPALGSSPEFTAASRMHPAFWRWFRPHALGCQSPWSREYLKAPQWLATFLHRH